jgi:hypothetical protein
MRRGPGSRRESAFFDRNAKHAANLTPSHGWDRGLACGNRGAGVLLRLLHTDLQCLG